MGGSWVEKETLQRLHCQNLVFFSLDREQYVTSPYAFEEIKKEFNLSNNQICLSGFSQGCMMSLNVGLTSEKEFNCIVGFSGRIINTKDLSQRIKNKTNILMIHGENDPIVPPSNLLEAEDFFIRNKIKIETLIIKNCDHHIPMEASSAALNFIKKNIVN